MKRSITILSYCILINLFFVISSGKAQERKEELIQVALLLDVSNSMDGLINQAKSQLWKIVNEFALARRNGKIPQLQVALYEYGKSTLTPKDNYIRKVVPLSTDLDKISEELFALNTKGGDEYCGAVIQQAVRELEWTSDNTCIKAIFIAGNETFTQGGINYREACKEAITKGIVVNTIFCGSQVQGINMQWKDGADLADGAYANIDQNQKIARVTTPQDAEIARLGIELNKTYVSFGSRGGAAKKRQARQDKMAKSVASEVLVQRSVAKASKQYNNSSWDLVDAAEENPTVLAEIKEDELPPEMKGMDTKEKKTYVEKMRSKRESIQKKINQLNYERRQYLAKEQKKASSQNTLDQAIINAIHKQAKKKNYSFE